MKLADKHFYDAVRGGRKVLAITSGGLGDIVHIVPALRSLRLSFPDARYEVLASHAGIPFLELVDGIDAFVPYTAQKSFWSRRHLREFWRLFRARYDLCINFFGSNHMSLVALTTMAPVRLGRKPWETHKIGWRLCHTHISDYPHLEEPMWQQWVNMLGRLGFRTTADFGIPFRPEKLAAAGLDPARRGRYIHVSPNASAATKELALPVMIDVLQQLCRRFPDLGIVVTGTAAPRQRERIERIAAQLGSPQVVSCIGNLKTDELFAVIQGAALHLSADTGTVHMAVAAGTPTVSWFQENPFIREYLPAGERHFAFVTAECSPDGISGIPAAAIVERCSDSLVRPLAAAAPHGATA